MHANLYNFELIKAQQAEARRLAAAERCTADLPHPTGSSGRGRWAALLPTRATARRATAG